MKTPLDRFVGAFALFFTPALPLLAGIITLHSQPVFLDAIGAIGGSQHAALPPTTHFVYTHFHALLWGLFALTLVLIVLSGLQLRVEDVSLRLGRQLLFAFAGATLGGVFLTLFLLATAQAFVTA